MNVQKLQDLVETIDISGDVMIEISAASDAKLQALAALTFAIILVGPEDPVAGIGALLALAMEATERRVRREGH